MSVEVYFAYVIACVALAILPGPVVTLVIANGLRHGTRAALVNVAGAQVGLAIVIALVGVGLASLTATIGIWFDWVRLLGAAYLVWIGINLIRSPALLPTGDIPPPPKGGFFLQGLMVLLTNPKVMVFFGAFIPQFVDPARPQFPQIVILGATFMVAAMVSDGLYAVLAGRARSILSASRARLLSRLSGGFMIGAGIWLALSRVR